MNVQSIKSQLQKNYSGKKIVVASSVEDTKEIICEIDPAKNHSEYSVCITVFDSITPHFHKKTTETYKVIRGVATIFLNDKKHILQKDESIQINPGVVHSAMGSETWVECSSKPGWVIEDHHLV